MTVTAFPPARLDGSAVQLVREACEAPPLAPEEESRLVGLAVMGDAPARDALVRSNLRIAVDEAILLRGLGRPQIKLIEIGVQALQEATAAYFNEGDEAGGFGSFARNKVRNAIARVLEEP